MPPLSGVCLHHENKPRLTFSNIRDHVEIQAIPAEAILNQPSLGNVPLGNTDKSGQAWPRPTELSSHPVDSWEITSDFCFDCSLSECLLCSIVVATDNWHEVEVKGWWAEMKAEMNLVCLRGDGYSGCSREVGGRWTAWSTEPQFLHLKRSHNGLYLAGLPWAWTR